MKVTYNDHLKELSSTSNGDFGDFYILFGVVARSSKRIVYHADSDEFSIIHEIDESYQEVVTKNLAPLSPPKSS